MTLRNTISFIIWVGLGITLFARIAASGEPDGPPAPALKTVTLAKAQEMAVANNNQMKNIDESIRQVYQTLIEAAIIVFVVIFIFLRKCWVGCVGTDAQILPLTSVLEL